MTKVTKNGTGNTLPAGLLTEIEAFYENGAKYLIINGTTMRFEDSPIKVQNKIAEHCLADKKAGNAIALELGTNAFGAVFDQWYRCRVGGLDSVADFSDDLNTFKPDDFNNQCTDYSCVNRGKICNNLGLSYFYMPTIHAIMQGKTVSETAKEVNLSQDGVKTQLKRIKEITGAKNNANLSALIASKGLQVSTFNTTCNG